MYTKVRKKMGRPTIKNRPLTHAERMARYRSKKKQKAIFQSKRHDWSTPQDLFDRLNAEFHFTLDPCATDETAKCERYFTPEIDGLKQSWAGETVFMNPPYGKALPIWMEKAHKEVNENGATVVALVPARTDTNWWHNHVNGFHVNFPKGRIRFGGCQKSAPFPSAIVVMKP